MAVFKCKMCGGALNIEPGDKITTCEYCGTQQTLPKLDSEKILTLFNRANRLRFACEFDKAAGIYESIVVEFPDEAEAYWGLILCQYGIEYIDDPQTAKKVPTCHRSSFQSVWDDENYQLVLDNADSDARILYSREANQIESLRKNIIEVSSKEEPYDIFICYKETDENGNRTPDSVLAQQVYNDLTSIGYRVFFSRITLEDKLGCEYEPYIFAALNSAKIMLAFGTNYEYYNAVWIRNEWSRFLQLITKGEKKTLIPCFKDIDAYDMPQEFAKLQAQDMGKLGAIQDLIRGIEKILPSSNLNREENNDQKQLRELKESYNNLLNAEKTRKKMAKRNRIIIAAIALCVCVVLGIFGAPFVNQYSKYNIAITLMETQNYPDAITAFEQLDGFMESRSKISECYYLQAVSRMESGNYKEAAESFKKSKNFMDSADKINECYDIMYNNAFDLIKDRNYTEAHMLFTYLGEYKDSAQDAEDLKTLCQMSVGQYITLGKYEQDDVLSNGSEKIEWLVLAHENGRALVVSKYALDAKPYNQTSPAIAQDSTLSKWLNDVFVNEAFNRVEKSIIISTNEKNAVFLLSKAEAEKYFESDFDRESEPTTYALNNGVESKAYGNCWWWLRDTDTSHERALAVNLSGLIYSYGIDVTTASLGVRPAMWIDLPTV